MHRKGDSTGEPRTQTRQTAEQTPCRTRVSAQRPRDSLSRVQPPSRAGRSHGVSAGRRGLTPPCPLLLFAPPRLGKQRGRRTTGGRGNEAGPARGLGGVAQLGARAVTRYTTPSSSTMCRKHDTGCVPDVASPFTLRGSKGGRKKTGRRAHAPAVGVREPLAPRRALPG